MTTDRLDGRIALVTGSSRGIGAACARELAAAGAAVVIHGRDEAAIDEVRRRVEADGGRAIGIAADISDAADVQRLHDTAQRELGPLDVVVANAGGSATPPGPVEDMTEDQWRATLDTNLIATFLTARAVLPSMKERGRGVIITMSSAASRRTTAMSPVAYAAAKAGIEALTRSIALQAGPAGVRAVCIAPETILTEENQQRIPEPLQQELARQHPVPRLGTPEDVARAVCFLASDRAGWISGVTLDVAGGSVLA
jgi:3-oxoacyl-[acyl-carrier protein] reductase